MFSSLVARFTLVMLVSLWRTAKDEGPQSSETAVLAKRTTRTIGTQVKTLWIVDLVVVVVLVGDFTKTLRPSIKPHECLYLRRMHRRQA